MEALEKEIKAIIDSESTDDSLDEAYKTKGQIRDELTQSLDGMKRDELINAQEKITVSDEEEVTQEVQESGEEEVEENADEDELDEAKLKEAYDDVKDSDEEEVDETDDSEEDGEGIAAVEEAMKKALKKSSVKVESARLKKASRKFYSENKKAVSKIVNGKTKVTKTAIKSSFEPRLTKDEVDVHVGALLEGEGLSEDFRTKASTIFESAVNSKVEKIVENLKEQFDVQLETTTTQIHEELTSQVDTYLDYVVEQWMEENKLAVESGLRTELTEDFIGGLKTLFEEHYIDVPEEKVDIFDDLSERVEELEEKLNTEIDKNIQLVEKLSDVNKRDIVESQADGLSEVQKEKLVELSESIDYTTQEEFTEKVSTLKESYFPQKIKETKEEAPAYTGSSSTVMDRYTQAISRTIK
tara:strand:- start:1457 stop:2695 length:1239 start_codon:yes stop_codon:yes gene_type:complete